MTQRVDVRSSGGMVLKNQLVTNTAMRARVWEEAGAGRTVTVQPSAVPAPKPPAGHPQAAAARYVLFADNDVLNALNAPAKYAVALSADPEFAKQATAENVAKLRWLGRRVYSWCDCWATMPPDAIGLMRTLDLDGWVGQAEDFNQYSNAMAKWPVAPVALVGNLTNLDAWQVEEIRTYKAPPFIQEDFWNEGWARHPGEAAIAAYCAGIYPTSLWNPQIQNYRSAGRWGDGDGLFHVTSVTDWSSLP